ncbi:hypothetical protein CAOG_09199 [Capsaspora owczarzaki ATCC 30864]|uniref:hypothetical protein n=1 Tax=Capsaspora owczarzaki (strain ATCC 30864) TaxID=595528 RepID=UPI00035227EE|nr:hypothetical protein CAOG_09199 [Capsaspora owczarzaki ATCC 30864]|eukprot:XP_011270916.1 hypothetical protein CAOG_09199 [Capsaspora owczarzaki ATCC 30864]
MALQQRSFAAFAAVAALLALSIAVLSAHVAHSGSGVCHVKSEAAAGWSRIAASTSHRNSLMPADQNSLDRRAVEFDFASNAFISVIFAIKQRNTDALASKLKAVSDPASEDYGKYMTR